MLLGGVSEVAEELGVSKQRLAKLRDQRGFPAPVANLSSGPVWEIEQVRRWANSGARRGPGRPSRARSTRVLGERFELGDVPIGFGGFADVFRAVDLEAIAQRGEDDVVAVKVLRSIDDEAARRRFARELRMMEDVDHPNIIPIIASGEDTSGRPWYAMPLAQGSLADRLADYADNDSQIVDVMRQICAGLAHLHERDEPIFHRDLTPMNVLLTDAGGWAISDFGLAREAERRTATLTTTTTNIGTFFYQAPETMTDARNAGIAADIYSLGRVLHALVDGQHPLPGGAIPHSDFAPIIRKATSFTASDRYNSVAEMLADIERTIAAPQGGWETTDEAIDRVLERVREGDDDAVGELVELAADADLDDEDLVRNLTRALTSLKKKQIDEIWDENPEAVRAAMTLFANGLRQSWAFEFCDVLADFSSRVINLTADQEILRAMIPGLCDLGHYHNRWHVRSVLVRILQSIRDTGAALAALEGLRQASRDDLEWSLDTGDFVVRSLHPSMRDGVRDLLGE
jgi:serine/threonine protein kinase